MDQTVEIDPARVEILGAGTPGALPGTDLAKLDPTPLLKQPGTFKPWFEQLREEVLAEAAQHDHTTEAGREKIRAVAYRVARLKTTIDKEGTSLTEDWRKSTKVVNEQRKVIEKMMGDLQDSVKADMEAWEAAEQARATKVAEVMQRLETVADFTIGTTAAAMQERVEKLRAFVIEEVEFRGDYHRAIALRDAAIPKIEAMVAATKKAEEEAAELAALRAEKAAREAQAAQAAAAERLRVEKEAREARMAEEAARRAEEDAAAQVAAAEKAREDAIRRGLDAEAAAVAAEEARKQAEADRQKREAEAAERLAAEAEEARTRRQQRQTEIRTALMLEGEITEGQADAILMAMIAGDIPHVTVAL